jgi:hypothetical protein
VREFLGNLGRDLFGGRKVRGHVEARGLPEREDDHDRVGVAVHDARAGDNLPNELGRAENHRAPRRGHRGGDGEAREKALGRPQKAVHAVGRDLVRELLAVGQRRAKGVAAGLGGRHVALRGGPELRELFEEPGHDRVDALAVARLRKGVHAHARVDGVVLDARDGSVLFRVHDERAGAEVVPAEDAGVQTRKVQAAHDVKVRAPLGVEDRRARVLFAVVQGNPDVVGAHEAFGARAREDQAPHLDLLAAQEQVRHGHGHRVGHFQEIFQDRELGREREREPRVLGRVRRDDRAVGARASEALEDLRRGEVELGVAQKLLGHGVERVLVELVLAAHVLQQIQVELARGREHEERVVAVRRGLQTGFHRRARVRVAAHAPERTDVHERLAGVVVDEHADAAREVAPIELVAVVTQQHVGAGDEARKLGDDVLLGGHGDDVHVGERVRLAQAHDARRRLAGGIVADRDRDLDDLVAGVGRDGEIAGLGVALQVPGRYLQPRLVGARTRREVPEPREDVDRVPVHVRIARPHGGPGPRLDAAHVKKPHQGVDGRLVRRRVRALEAVPRALGRAVRRERELSDAHRRAVGEAPHALAAHDAARIRHRAPPPHEPQQLQLRGRVGRGRGAEVYEKVRVPVDVRDDAAPVRAAADRAHAEAAPGAIVGPRGRRVPGQAVRPVAGRPVDREEVHVSCGGAGLGARARVIELMVSRDPGPARAIYGFRGVHIRTHTRAHTHKMSLEGAVCDAFERFVERLNALEQKMDDVAAAAETARRDAQLAAQLAAQRDAQVSAVLQYRKMRAVLSSHTSRAGDRVESGGGVLLRV